MRTGVKVQRAMFLESLWRQMDKISSAASDQNIAKVADTYLAEGYEEHEVIELLVDDGFDPVLAKSCVGMVVEAVVDDQQPKWGFEVEDLARGDIYNNFDIGMDGSTGNDEATAMEDAQVIVDARYPGQYMVTRAFAL